MFFECEFPRKLSYGMVGGAGFNTQINLGFSGFEQRNRNWAKARSKWTVMVTSKQNDTTGIVTDFDLLRNFQLVLGGQADGFRLFEPTDFSASHLDASGGLGLGDGSNKIFQLQKTYSIAGRTYIRKISKPITPNVVDYQNHPLGNTVAVYVNGVLKSLGTDYSIDYTTGIITFVTAPPAGQPVTADFQFHYPVRLNTDDFPATIQDSNVTAGKAIVTVQLDIMELRL